MNSIYYSRWRASHSGCPCLPVSERNYAPASSAPLAVWRCDWGSVKVKDRPRWAQGHRRLTLRAATLRGRPPSVLPLSGNAAAGGEKNLPRPSSRQNKAAIISLIASCLIGRSAQCEEATESRAKSHDTFCSRVHAESQHSIQFSVKRKQDLKDLFVQRWST